MMRKVSEKSKETSKIWRKNNKEKIKETQRIFYQNNPEYKKEYNKIYMKSYYEKNKENARKYRFKKFNITPEDYDKIFNEQKGCCAICGKHQLEFKLKLAVDHCHTTGKIRGLCCSNCNLVIGHAHDNVEVLKNAIKYLSKV
jgi:hypothetical protein